MKIICLLSAIACGALPAAAQDFNLLPPHEQPTLDELRQDPDTRILVPTRDGFREVPPGELEQMPDASIMVPMTNPVVRMPLPAKPIPVAPVPVEPPSPDARYRFARPPLETE